MLEVDWDAERAYENAKEQSFLNRSGPAASAIPHFNASILPTHAIASAIHAPPMIAHSIPLAGGEGAYSILSQRSTRTARAALASSAFSTRARRARCA